MLQYKVEKLCRVKQHFRSESIQQHSERRAKGKRMDFHYTTSGLQKNAFQKRSEVKNIWRHFKKGSNVILCAVKIWWMLANARFFKPPCIEAGRERCWGKKKERAAGKRACRPHLYSPPSNSLELIYISATSIATRGRGDGLSGASLI